MKNKLFPTGDVRKMDGLGRVVIPAKLRRDLDIKESDSLEMFVDEENIILQKYTLPCIFCGTTDLIVEYKDKNICNNCLSDLKGIVNEY